MNGRILDIGGRLDVGDDDIKAIASSRRKNTILGYLIKGIAPIMTFIAGFLLGVQTRKPINPPYENTYPYVTTAIIVSLAIDRRDKTIAETVILSAIAFIFAFVIAVSAGNQPITGLTPAYGVSTCK